MCKVITKEGSLVKVCFLPLHNSPVSWTVCCDAVYHFVARQTCLNLRIHKVLLCYWLITISRFYFDVFCELLFFYHMYAFSCDTHWCNHHSTSCHVKPHLNWCDGITRDIYPICSLEMQRPPAVAVWSGFLYSHPGLPSVHTQYPVRNFKAGILKLEWLYKPLLYLTY